LTNGTTDALCLGDDRWCKEDERYSKSKGKGSKPDLHAEQDRLLALKFG
jgi:hypothetical protein